MVGNRERRWAPPIQRVAALAFSSVRSLRELPAVRIRRVAISALRVRNLSLEIPALVARFTGHSQVFSNEWIVRLRVIERLSKRCLFPSGCAVARLARLVELTFVRIAMTIRTVFEFDARILRLSIRARRMAAFALDVPMLAGERIARLRVVERLLIKVLCCSFPVSR